MWSCGSLFWKRKIIISFNNTTFVYLKSKVKQSTKREFFPGIFRISYVKKEHKYIDHFQSFVNSLKSSSYF